MRQQRRLLSKRQNKPRLKQKRSLWLLFFAQNKMLGWQPAFALALSMLGLDANVPVNYLKGNRYQLLPLTGPGHALAVLNNEQGAVGGTLNQRIIHIEKLVLEPVQFNPEVGTLIAV